MEIWKSMRKIWLELQDLPCILDNLSQAGVGTIFTLIYVYSYSLEGNHWKIFKSIKLIFDTG